MSECKSCVILGQEVERLRAELAEAHSRLAAAMASAERSVAMRSEAESKADQAEARLREVVEERDQFAAAIKNCKAEILRLQKLVPSDPVESEPEAAAQAEEKSYEH